MYHNKAFSILLKEIQADEIKRALLQSVRSEQYICRQISNLIRSYNPDKQNNRQNLTHTETEILKLIARGYSTKEIATQRISSIHTIITHKKNIFRKLEVNTVYEATKYALKAGLIDSAEYYI
ncbi:MAG: response regulator transcription factor [Barnesiella sp.]